MKDVYEEYRERLITKNADILILEIFETFIGTDFIDNSLDLLQILETKDYKEILEELKNIQKNIFKTITNKYSIYEKKGYKNIVDGYILRVESILNKEKYVAGAKVELIKMYDANAVPPGTKGIIDFIDDIGTLHMIWENGSSLGLVVGVDEFKIIGVDEK